MNTPTRTPPPARPGGRLGYEFRVTFPARVTAAVLTSPTAPLPPVSPRAVAPPPPAPQPVERPADFWHSDVARELRADRERIDAALTQIRAAVDGYRADQAARLHQWQRAAVELAVTVATRLLHERVTAGDFPTEAKVRDMAAQLGADAPVAVHLNPVDLSLLETRLGGDPLLPGRGAPALLADPALARGECRVEGKESVLLTDVTRDLQDLRDDLLRSLGNARA